MGMIDNPITSLVGEELGRGDHKWRKILAAPNGSLYGIPCGARKVVKFNPVDKSIAYIGPDFDDYDVKWWRGAMTDSGIIYCPPCESNRGILKIDTNTDTVTELDRNLLPQRGHCNWISCAAALDGCIYCMPYNRARRIMKIDPNDNDTISSVGDDLEEDAGYSGTVVGIDGCVYGIPFFTNRIIKYDPINNITSYVGEELDGYFRCNGGALGRDGCIYAITKYDEVLKIDSINNVHCFVENWIESDHHEEGWGDAVMGVDDCIYWPPYSARRILKYDPHTNQTSHAGDDFGDTLSKWFGGCLAADGVIYCIPDHTNRILSIDPWKGYTSSLENIMIERPEQLGYIFYPSDDMPTETNFDRAVIKFGYKKVMKALEACMHPVDQLCATSNLYPVMIAASFNMIDVSVIYHLLRQVPSLMNCINPTQDE